VNITDLNLGQLSDLRNWMEQDIAIDLFYPLLSGEENRAIERLIKGEDQSRGIIIGLRKVVQLHDEVLKAQEELQKELDGSSSVE